MRSASHFVRILVHFDSMWESWLVKVCSWVSRVASWEASLAGDGVWVPWVVGGDEEGRGLLGLIRRFRRVVFREVT